MFYTTDHGYSNANMTHRRRNRTRKFNLNMSWYGTLYKRIKGSQKMWTLHHNPLHGKLLFLSVRVVHMICLNNSYTLTETHKISLQGKAPELETLKPDIVEIHRNSFWNIIT